VFEIEKVVLEVGRKHRRGPHRTRAGHATSVRSRSRLVHESTSTRERISSTESAPHDGTEPSKPNTALSLERSVECRSFRESDPIPQSTISYVENCNRGQPKSRDTDGNSDANGREFTLLTRGVQNRSRSRTGDEAVRLSTAGGPMTERTSCDTETVDARQTRLPCYASSRRRLSRSTDLRTMSVSWTRRCSR
jgi:hypothetical protein